MYLSLYNNDTIKWRHEGKRYCLHIRRDDCPDDPRSWGNLTTMACFHRRYSLGDKLETKSPEEFWQRLVYKHVPREEAFEAVCAGKLEGIRATPNEIDPNCADIYETYCLHTILGNTEPEEVLEYERVPADSILSYIGDDLTISHCQTLLEPYIEWLPLWLYDHSGITMSCGARTGQYADRWDASCVGWIIAEKDVIMKETRQILRDENGNPIREEYRHPDGSVTYGVKSLPLTEKTWRDRAIEIMESDVEVYDMYLTGDVYGYTLYEAESVDDDEEPEWNENDSCWGFYGDNIFENGILEHVGCGLREALESRSYERGEAELHHTTYYTF